MLSRKYYTVENLPHPILNWPLSTNHDDKSINGLINICRHYIIINFLLLLSASKGGHKRFIAVYLSVINELESKNPSSGPFDSLQLLEDSRIGSVEHRSDTMVR